MKVTREHLRKLTNPLPEPVYTVGDVSIALPEVGKQWNSYNTVLEYNYADDTRRVLLVSTDLTELCYLFPLIRAKDPTVFAAIKQCHEMCTSGLYDLVLLGFDVADMLPYIRGTFRDQTTSQTTPS